ncbi:ABC transporter ATP-binding protein [Enterococcus sp. BWB1-3]|uniref:ATP-binding cassette domain-containing protein n=1 Tax=Enterococcus sp. BWB1-3 TaxID=2787713 RepID=UPI0019204FE8|nr:ATP-binding cassette domain-containing protein [Enterococcus sp. BWB1-3]MBL1230607.1 ABC transporter ATP-binding protein [Enterococcus sp. BWB1-3]
MIELTECSITAEQGKLLDSISLKVPKGAYFCLIGESGGGKTLLGKMILGILPPNLKVSGKINCDRKKMEIILQNPLGSLQSNSRIDSQFHHLLKSKGMKNKEDRKMKMFQALSRVGFTAIQEIAAKRPYQLSGGMCQKAALAMALISQPEIIIADEATSALDEQSQETILQLLSNLYLEKQLTIFFITHDLSIAKAYSTHLGVMQNGQLIEVGLTEQVLNHPTENYTKELIGIFEQDDSFITGKQFN